MQPYIAPAALLLAVVNIASAAPAQPEVRYAEPVTLFGVGPNPPTLTLSPSFGGEFFSIGKQLVRNAVPSRYAI